jgi:four helix bundle protein
VEYRTENIECRRKENEHRDFDLQDRLIEFSVRIMDVAEALPTNRNGNLVAGQVVRSGTSPAPNYGEAQAAESRRDSIHKMKLSLKELRETYTWLLVIQRKPLIESAARLDPIVQECNELISIFVASIKTPEGNK